MKNKKIEKLIENQKNMKGLKLYDDNQKEQFFLLERGKGKNITCKKCKKKEETIHLRSNTCLWCFFGLEKPLQKIIDSKWKTQFIFIENEGRELGVKCKKCKKWHHMIHFDSGVCTKCLVQAKRSKKKIFNTNYY